MASERPRDSRGVVGVVVKETVRGMAGMDGRKEVGGTREKVGRKTGTRRM